MIGTRPVPGSLLIVDDNQAFGRLLAWEFEDLGYAVCTAADCRQAVEAAETTTFDFALLDFHLPDGDGRFLSRRLRQILPRLQMVTMSADRAGATAGGTDPQTMAFVGKPVPLERIRRLFGARGKIPPASGGLAG